MKETLEDTLNGVLDSRATDDIIVAWNEYCQRDNDYDSMIFRNDPSFFMDNYSEYSLWGLVTHISQGNYNSSDNYVVYSKQTGNLNSFNYLCDTYCPYDQSALVDWLIRTYGDNLKEIGEFLGTDIEVEEDEDGIGYSGYWIEVKNDSNM